MPRFLNVGERGKVRGSWYQYPAIRRHIGAGGATRRRATRVVILLCASAVVLLLVVVWISQLKSILRVPQIQLQAHRLGGRHGSDWESHDRFRMRTWAERQKVAEVADVLDIEFNAASKLTTILEAAAAGSGLLARIMPQSHSHFRSSRGRQGLADRQHASNVDKDDEGVQWSRLGDSLNGWRGGKVVVLTTLTAAWRDQLASFVRQLQCTTARARGERRPPCGCGDETEGEEEDERVATPARVGDDGEGSKAEGEVQRGVGESRLLAEAVLEGGEQTADPMRIQSAVPRQGSMPVRHSGAASASAERAPTLESSLSSLSSQSSPPMALSLVSLVSRMKSPPAPALAAATEDRVMAALAASAGAMAQAMRDSGDSAVQGMTSPHSVAAAEEAVVAAATREESRQYLRGLDLVKMLVVVAYDEASQEACQSLGLRCFYDVQGAQSILASGAWGGNGNRISTRAANPSASSSSGDEANPLLSTLTSQQRSERQELTYGTNKYNALMWKRLRVLSAALSLGFDVVFSDLDVLWLKDPLPYLFRQPGDMVMSCDFYRHGIDMAPNAGFYLVRSNSRTLQFYDYWMQAEARYPGMHDQDVFRKIQPEMDMHSRLVIGLQAAYLDTRFFGSLCEAGTDLSRLFTVHATCVVGRRRKVDGLKGKLADFHRFCERVEWQAAVRELGKL